MTLLFILLLVISAIVISGVSNFLVLNFAKTLGIRNKNNVSVRWSNESKPSLGGISMYVVFIFSGLILSLLFTQVSEWVKLEYVGLFIASTMAFAMGVADDAYDTKPVLKISVQLLCGLVLIFTDNAFPISNNLSVNYLFTILWVLTLMNSLNMLDNMDGITATTCCTVLMSCLAVVTLSFGWVFSVWSVLMLTSLGTLIGFLIYNVHPSKMFMGDGGSQFLGLTIAFFTGKIFFGLPETQYNISGLLLALVALTPAAVDTLTVVINRLKKGHSPMIGGKDHTTHHLVYAGLSDIQVWYVFTGIGLISILISALTYHFLISNIWMSLAIGLGWFLLVFIVLYRITLRYPNKSV